ncbi:MAG TPA: AAA family ATPase [Candidatus Omnitrophota bacterium]|nr:AAA family ATPase [Candidatus Omnitrophota bacterium]
MSLIIAIAGKGGTGKTTVSSLIVTQLAKRNKGSVLAIDADPNSNLAEALGLKVKEGIGGIVDSVAKKPDIVPVGMSKDRYIDYRIQTSIVEETGFDLLTMGRPEGPGCYCYVNNLLRTLIKNIANEYDYVVIDNEAGFEHFSRKTMRRADRLLLVSDSSEAGLRAAQRIVNLVKELEIEIKNAQLILNRMPVGTEQCSVPAIRDKLSGLGIETIGIIPEDEKVLALSRCGQSITNLDQSSKALGEIKKILDKILV